MPNSAERAAYWRTFIETRCDYPAPKRLRAQFAAATFEAFCSCGCNSFAVRIPQDADLPPLVAPGNIVGAQQFEARFALPLDQRLEILLFVDARGYLNYVEVDCCFNAFPVPADLTLDGPPLEVIMEDGLLPD